LGVQSLGFDAEKPDEAGGLLATSSALKITVENFETATDE
jgi:hypothetical protein